MVNYQESLDATFGALADPTRRAILARLSSGDLRVTDVAEPFDVSLPAVTKHLDVLERAGLVVREKEGRVRRCQLVASPLREAAEWIERYRRFWESQFDALARYLGETANEEAEKADEGNEGKDKKEEPRSWPPPKLSRRKPRKPRSR